MQEFKGWAELVMVGVEQDYRQVLQQKLMSQKPDWVKGDRSGSTVITRLVIAMKY